MSPLQLSIDGRETPVADTRPPRLTHAQRDILRWLLREGSIRAVEAGNIVHAHRRDVFGHGRKWEGNSLKRLGCCPYAATDGSAALRRLAQRGMVAHPARGRWELAA